MRNLTNCRNGCVYAQQKKRVWQLVADHNEGICTDQLVEWTNLPPKDVENITEDLHVEGKIYRKRDGRWHLEMLPIH
ncbi:MAG: hypothetical protein KDE56_01225 [Anaerolineales bacterium]|nr:hypothetical protein [Anaerolineales bacterium]